MNMKHRKAGKHGTREKREQKVLDDGKERDKFGYLIEICAIRSCEFKAGIMSDMKMHK